MATQNFYVVYDPKTGQQLRHIKDASHIKHHIQEGEYWFEIHPDIYDSFRHEHDLNDHVISKLVQIHPELSALLNQDATV